jgi:hypothetical protein
MIHLTFSLGPTNGLILLGASIVKKSIADISRKLKSLTLGS